MNKQEHQEIEEYMLSQMQDSSHDRNHIYRVLNAAMDIYNYEYILIMMYWQRPAYYMILGGKGNLPMKR